MSASMTLWYSAGLSNRRENQRKPLAQERLARSAVELICMGQCPPGWGRSESWRPSNRTSGATCVMYSALAARRLHRVAAAGLGLVGDGRDVVRPFAAGSARPATHAAHPPS